MTDPAAIAAGQVNIIAPVSWKTESFWVTRRGRTLGIVAAFSPTVFAIGLERIAGYSRGLAVMVGPFWIGFAIVRASLASTVREGEGGSPADQSETGERR